MKKFFKSVSVICLTFSVLMSAISAYAEESAIEITFCVGDDTLMINGESVQVETPYVVADGVTLVPLRVITEAFGAQVEWINDTQTVILTYPDVEIELQIGSSIADVNGKAETLPAAPELKNAFTMVPLRFISETFGAEVTFDDETSEITVYKSGVSEEGSIIEAGIDSLMIGDSFYNWSMENPGDMTVYDRSADGKYTYLESEENYDYIEISIEEIDENYDFESDFNRKKYSIDDYTLVVADKNIDDEAQKSMHFQYKDKYEFVDRIIIVTDKFCYDVQGSFDAEDDELCEEGARIISTFKTSFVNIDTHDLYKSVEGYETYETEHMGVTIDLPAKLYDEACEDLINSLEVESYDDEYTGVYIDMYSVSDSVTAQAIAKKSYDIDKYYMDGEKTDFSDSVSEVSYTDMDAYEYNYTFGSKKPVMYVRKIFYDKGDYVYNITIKLPLPDDYAEKTADTILNSVKTKELTNDDLGNILYNYPELEGNYVSKHGDWSLIVPEGYIEDYADEDGASYTGKLSGSDITFSASVSQYTNIGKIKETFKQAESQLKAFSSAEILQSPRQTMIDGTAYIEFIFSTQYDEESPANYTYVLATCKKGRGVEFVLSADEYNYSENTKADFLSIVKSLTLN